MKRVACLLATLGTFSVACDGIGSEPLCGPPRAFVDRVIDGDTVVLEGGERVRSLLIDTPETMGGEVECFGDEATRFKADLVLGREVELLYDEECRDRFGRLLAYLVVEGRDVSELLVDRGFACVLHIPPNGADRVDHFRELESRARHEGRGMWGACQEVPCAN